VQVKKQEYEEIEEVMTPPMEEKEDDGIEDSSDD